MSGDDGTVTGRYHVLGTASCAGVKASLGPKQVGQETWLLVPPPRAPPFCFLCLASFSPHFLKSSACGLPLPALNLPPEDENFQVRSSKRSKTGAAPGAALGS